MSNGHDEGHKHTRRRFLRHVAAAAAAAPFLRSFPLSADAALPKLVIFATPNGWLVGPDGDPTYGVEGWRPAGVTGRDAALPARLPQIFRPLEPHRDSLLMLDRVTGVPGGGHTQAVQMLTGRRRIRVSVEERWASGISVDQHLAQQLRTRVLNLSGYLWGNPSEMYISHLEARRPVTPIQSPRDAFERVFGDAGATDLARQQALARRASVLDVVARDIADIQRRLPPEDRLRLEAHLDGVRELETELTGEGAGGCASAIAPDSYDHTREENRARVMHDHMDILVRALSCGWGRIATLQLGSMGGALYPRWPEYGLAAGDHDHAISHKFNGGGGAGSDDVSREDAVRWGLASRTAFSQMLARLLDRLAAATDVDGRPMLDNTIVVHVMGMGINHVDSHLLWLVAGGRALGARAGRYLVVGSEGSPRYYNDLWTTVCRLMGQDVSTFGDTSYCREPLSLS